MTRDEKKQWLSRYLYGEREVALIRERLLKVCAEVESVGQVLSDMPKGKSRTGDRVQNTVEKMMMLQNRLCEEFEKNLCIMDEIEAKINTCSESKYRILLTYKYITGLSLEKIAEKMGYEYRWIRRLHNQAVDSLDI